MSDAPLPLLYALGALALAMVVWLIVGEVRSWRRGARKRGIQGLAQQLDAMIAGAQARAEDIERLDGMRAAGLLPPVPDPSREPGWGERRRPNWIAVEGRHAVRAAGRTFANTAAWADWMGQSPIHDRIAAEIEAARVGAERHAVRAEIEYLGVRLETKP